MDKVIIEKKGTITDLIFRNSQNGYTIAVFETEEEQFTAVGSMAEVLKGADYVLRGKFVMHPSYGEQFSFSEYEQLMPTGAKAIEDLLGSGIIKGVGKKTAAAIVSKFGEDTFHIFEEEPGRLKEVPGIGDKKAAQILQSYALHREFANISIYFQKFGISSIQVMKLYKMYGSQTIRLVEENPYRLVDDIFGIGFKKADEIARKIGIAENDPARIAGGIRYALQYYAQEGNTYCPQQELCEKTGQMLDVSMEEVRDRLVSLAFEGEIAIENVNDRNQVYLMPYYRAEMNVTKCISRLVRAELRPVNADVSSLISMTEKEAGMSLSEKQRFAVSSSVGNGVSVITGGPGTGKTTIINSIIGVFEASGFTVAIAAPTGRAAKRITETSGHEASTIHRLLEYYYSESDDSMQFGRNAENPVDANVVIVDEASMIDILLMNALVSALVPGTRLIMVGDADQLPSVGAGNVLRDIIESEYVYSTRLTEIFRQAAESLIVVNAHRINRGEYPEYNEKGKEFFFMRKQTEKEMLDLVKNLVSVRLPAYYDWLDPLKDIQVLTPVRKGTLGIYNLNKVLQEVLNPADHLKGEKNFGDRLFREGDKVMQIRNNYQLSWKRLSDFTEGEGVFNGDIGFVDGIDKEYNQMTVVFDEDKYVTYEFSQMEELELAYAITVHKSQGSEFPVMVMPVSWFPPMLATRNLLYTAVTRGREAVVLVGSENKLCAMVDNNRITSRYSGLRSKLSRMLEAGL